MRPDEYEREVPFKIPLVGAALIAVAGTLWIGPGLGVSAGFVGFVILLVGAILFTPPRRQ